MNKEPSRRDMLDVAIRPLTRSCSTYARGGVHYKGDYKDRSFDIYCREVRPARGSVAGKGGEQIEIIMDSRLATRLAVALLDNRLRKIWTRIYGQLEPVAAAQANGLMAWAAASKWSRALFKNDRLVQGLKQLLTSGDDAGARSLSLMPDAGMLVLRHVPISQVTTENVKTLLLALHDWLEGVEEVTPRPQRLDATSMERNLRGSRSLFHTLSGALLLLLFLGGAAAAVLAYIMYR